MADEIKKSDAQVDASIDISFAESYESAEKFAKSIEALDGKLTTLVGKLKELPAGLADSLDTSLKAANNKSGAKLDVNTAEITEKLKVALQRQISEMLKSLDFAKIDTSDMTDISQAFSAEAKIKLEKSMRSVKDKMESVVKSIGMIDDAVTTYALEYANMITTEMHGTSDFKRKGKEISRAKKAIKDAVDGSLNDVEKAFAVTSKDASDFNEKLAMDMKRAGMEFESLDFDKTLGSVKNTVEAVNKFFRKVDMLSVNMAESLNALIPDGAMKHDFAPIDIEGQVREAVRKAANQIVISSGDDKITLDGDVIDQKVKQAINSAMDGITITPKDVEQLQSAVDVMIRNLSAQVRGITIDQTSKFEASMEVLADAMADTIISSLQKAYVAADVSAYEKVNVEMDVLATRITSKVFNSLDAAVDAAPINFSDEMKEHMTTIKLSIQKVLEQAVDSVVVAAATGAPVADMVKTNLTQGTLAKELAARTVKLEKTDGAIEIDGVTVDGIINRVSQTINQRLRSTPLQIDRSSAFSGTYDKDSLGEVLSASKFMDTVLKARKEAIDIELSQAMMAEEAKSDSQYNMVQEIVKGEGGIRRYKDGSLSEEYSLIPKSLRRKDGWAADQMAEIINGQLGLGWTEADLYSFFDNNKRQARQTKKALKEKVTKQVDRDMFDGSFKAAQAKLIETLPASLGLDVKAMFANMHPEQQLSAVTRMLNQSSGSLGNLSKSELNAITGLSGTYDKAGIKPINLTRFRKEIVSTLNAENKRLVDLAIAGLSEGTGSADAQKVILSSIDYAVDKFAKDYAKAIREITRSSVVSQSIADHLEARVVASVQSITGKNGMKMTQVTATVKTCMQLIMDTIENRIAEGILEMKYPKFNMKLDTVLMKALAEDISKELNTAIAATSIPNMAGQIKIDEAALRSVLTAIEGVVYRYADNLGRAFALSPAFNVETAGLSARLKSTIEKAQGTLPDQISNGDLIAAIMAKDAVDLDNNYNRHLKNQIKQYKTTVNEQLDRLTIEPNMELALTFKDEMTDLQNKIYRRIKQIIKAQMEAFDVAINQTIVEPIRSMPVATKKMDVYNKLAQPMVETSKGMERQAKLAQKSAERARGSFERALYSTGMHVLAGSVYSVPFYMAYKAKEAIVDISDYESKIRQNILMSPQAEVNGKMDTGMMNMLYKNQLEPYIQEVALKYGETLPETFNAATVVTRRNRPLVEQRMLLNAVMRLKAIDNVAPEEGAAVLEAVQSQLKLDPVEIDKVVREIAAAVSVTQATGTDIGETLKRSAVIGHSVGLGSAEMITLASVMAQATGQKGDVIGTFLKTALDRMSKSGTQPVLDKAFEAAYAKGVLKEKMSVYDEQGNMNSPLKILSAVAQMSGKIPDKDMFEIYRKLFGEWQKGRGVALLGELAPSGEADTEGTYMNSIQDYLLDLDSMLERITSLTAEQEQMLINENMDKAEYYINRVNTSFQMMVRALADEGALDNLKTFANVLTNLMTAVANNPDGVQNTIKMLMDLVLGFAVYKGAGKFIGGETGIGTKFASDFAAGYNYYSPKGQMQKFNTNIQNNAQDFMPTLLGSTFNFKQATEADMLNKALTQKAVYDTKRAKTLNYLQTRRGMTAEMAEQWLGDKIHQRMLKGDRITTKSGATRQLYEMGKVDLTWMERLKQMKPDVQDTFNDVQKGVSKTRMSFKGLTTTINGSTTGVKNLGKTSAALNTLRDAGRGTASALGGVAKSIGGIAKQLAIMYAIALTIEQLGSKSAFNQLTGSQKVDATANEVAGYLNADTTKRAKLMEELQGKGLNTAKFENTPTEMLLRMLGSKTGGGAGAIKQHTREVYGDGNVRDSDLAALKELDKLGFMDKAALNLKYLPQMLGEVWTDTWGRTVDYDALSKALGQKVTSKNIDGVLSGYLVNPDKLAGYEEQLRAILMVQKETEINADKSVPSGKPAELERDRRVDLALKNKTYDKDTVKQAVINAISKPLKLQSQALKEQETLPDLEVSGYQSKISSQVDGVNNEVATALGLAGDTEDKNPTGTLLEKLSRELSAKEDATSIRELMLKYRGFEDDSTLMQQSMIAQKTSEIGTIKSQIKTLENYTPENAEDGLQVQERIAELNRKMWETLVDIKELQKNDGTFNLPEGLKVMTDYEYYQQKGKSIETSRVSVGDTVYQFNISGIDPKDKVAVQQNVIDPLTKAFNNFRRDKEVANALTRQVARGVGARP